MWALRAKAQINLIHTRRNSYPFLQNVSPKSFPIVLNSNSIPLMIRIKMSAISDFSSPSTTSRACRLYPEPSPAHHLYHWHSGPSHYHLLPGSRQLHVGWYLLPLTLMIISSTATMAILSETGHSSVSHPTQSKSHSHAHCLAAVRTPQTLCSGCCGLCWSVPHQPHMVSALQLSKDFSGDGLLHPRSRTLALPPFSPQHLSFSNLLSFCFISWYIFPQKITQS